MSRTNNDTANTKTPAPAATTTQDDEPDEPYSIYTTHEKWIIVSIISLAGLYSPLTANIYFPAIPTLTVQFHKSTELLNLTVTVYMVLQGVSPVVWGPLSDSYGRRPMFLACLLLLSLTCVGLACIPTSAFWALLLLRCISAAGSASTIALGAGVIGDISIAAERGGFFGLYSLGPMAGPSIGPVLGGALAQGLGWRAIFWFLCIASAACLLFMILFLPETLRALVGNGSILPSRMYRPLIPIIGRNRRSNAAANMLPPPKLRNPFILFTQPDIVLLLLFNAVPYAVYYSITASISTLFTNVYPYLTETDIGLCFLASGGGMIFGSIITGKILDFEYQKIKKQLASKAEKVAQTSNEMSERDISFPIELARLRTMPFYLTVFVASAMGYGWCMEKRVSIAGPLVLHVMLGYSCMALMNTTQTLIVDLLPNQGSAITACNNLVRCSFGAAAVSVIQLMLDAVGAGYAYLILGGLCILVSPALWIIIRIGPRYREKRSRQAIAASSDNTITT